MAMITTSLFQIGDFGALEAVFVLIMQQGSQGLFFIRLLSVVRKPSALGHGHVCERRLEGGILRAAGVYAEADRAFAVGHMTHAHLLENLAVFGAFDAVVVLAAAEAIPHGLDVRRDFGGRPVGIAVVGDDAAQMLEALIFVFDRALEPVFAVQIHHDAALVETVLAFEGGLHGEGEVWFVRFRLQHGRVVVAEVIIRPLPQVGVRLGDDFDAVFRNGKALRLAGPDKRIHIKLHVESSGSLFISV